MKKSGILLSSLLLVTTLLSACGNSTDSSSASGGSGANDKVTLTVTHYMVEKPKVDTFKKLTDRFTELNPNITFDVQVMPVDKYNDNIKMKVVQAMYLISFLVVRKVWSILPKQVLF